MWKTSLYRGRYHGRSIRIDVTLSAPPFDKPVNVLPNALAYLKKVAHIRSVLDFGAGKLRNTLFLVKKGFRVCAVEYGSQFESLLGARRLETAQRFAGFQQLMLPHEFLKQKKRFDLVLLANVIQIIPVEMHRALVLRLCAGCLRKHGYLLWISQRGMPLPGSARRFRDGYLFGLYRERTTFYRDFTTQEIDHMLQPYFHLVKSFPSPRTLARLYQKLN